ncbi:CAP domain-containing protein [Planctomycetaceae bacterium SH139]
MKTSIQVLLTLCVSAVTTATAAEHDTHALAYKVFQETNQFRLQNNMKPLKGSAILNRYAIQWSRTMASDLTLTHSDDNFQTTTIRAMGIPDRGSAENVQRNGRADPAARAVEWWKDSPGHRANLLHPSAEFLGVGAAKGSDGKYYFTQIFVKGPNTSTQTAAQNQQAFARTAIESSVPAMVAMPSRANPSSSGRGTSSRWAKGAVRVNDISPTRPIKIQNDSLGDFLIIRRGELKVKASINSESEALWLLQPLNNDSEFLIKHQATGKCLGYANGQLNVALLDEARARTLGIWRFDQAGDGYTVRCRNILHNLAVDVARDESIVFAYAFEDWLKQKWYLK